MKPDDTDQHRPAASRRSAWFETFVGYKPQVLEIIHLLEQWEPELQAAVVRAEAPSQASAESGLESSGGGQP